MTKALEEQVLDLAWSQWAALGVSASGVRVPQHAVDLEAALSFAPLLEELDPRLFREVVDWCVTFAAMFTSVSRLKRLLQLFDEEHRVRFESFAALANAKGGTKWPTRDTAPVSDFMPSMKSSLRLDRATSVQLRARKVFGVNARAEILLGLALAPDSSEPRWTSVAVLSALGYSKRNLSEALGDLAVGGMLAQLKFGNTLRFSLIKREPLLELLSPVPSTPTQPWAQRYALVASLLGAVSRTRGKSATTRAVELKRVLELGRTQFERSLVPIPNIGPDEPLEALARWIEPLLQP